MLRMTTMTMLLFLCLALCAVLTTGDVTVTISQHWEGGFQGKACLPVDKDMHTWKVRLVFDQPITTLDAYTADVVEQSADNTEFVLGNRAWNGEEHVGDEVCLEFQGHGTGDIQPVITAFFEGEPGSHSTHAAMPTHSAPQTTHTPGGGGGGVTSGVTTPHSIHHTGAPPSGDGVHSVLTMVNDWGERFKGAWTFPLETYAVGWMINMTFSSPIIKMDIQEGEAISHTSDNLNWVIVDKPDKALVPQGSFTLNFFGTRGAPTDTKLTGQAVFVNLGVDRTGHVNSLPNKGGSKYNYDDLLMKSILFYEAQRSGKLPADNRIPWRGDSALGDQGANGEDLTGGWYDAGDHIKFNYPMAYSTVVLSWGLLEFKDAYVASGQLDHMYDSIRWPLDYLLKCHVADDVLYVQVGDGGPDHSYWGRPEDMTMPRPAYKIDATNPGSDVSMETAAAFAAGHMAFKDKDPTYSATLLAHAKTLWQFAVDHHGIYSNSVQAAAGFYRSMNFTDEMCWGSLWLYKATGEDKYLTEARKWFDPTPEWGMSWDDKIIGTQVLMYNLTGDAAAKTAVEGSLTSWFPGGAITYTPKGLAWRLQWGSLRYSSNMAMAALMAAQSGLHADEYRHWATCQLHYALGDTGFSYVIGYGDQGWPMQPHHRAASCPLSPAPCGSAMETSKAPSPHTLYGALVGGPGVSDDYVDSRTDYTRNEVACDYNAGFQTAIAGLRHLLLTHQHPEQTGSSTCPYS